jgi:ATP synthase protein I
LEQRGVSANEPGRPDRRWLRQLGVLSGVGLTLVISTVLGLWGGYLLDGWLGSSPWLMLLGLLLGIASGFVNLFRATGVLDRDGRREERDDPP